MKKIILLFSLVTVFTFSCTHEGGKSESTDSLSMSKDSVCCDSTMSDSACVTMDSVSVDTTKR